MNRTLGFFLGSTVVFGLLVLVLGQPVSLAPPGNRNLQSAEFATAPIRIPAPINRESQVLTQPVTASSTTSDPVSVVATMLAGSNSDETQVREPVTRPVVVEDVDENRLAESWLATIADPASSSDMPTDSPDADTAETPAHGTASMTEIDVPIAPAVAPGQIEWFPVWDPFHSELSANAFARRLERVTGLDYRVVKTGPAQYRVVMAYSSEEQRSVNVSLIEQATGLSITGGSL